METFEDLLKFESQKHIEFFLPYYQKKGWKVLQDNLGKNTDWDVLIERMGQRIRVDEKARQKDYSDFLIEIIQDLKTGHLSWLYKEKDIYLYASWCDVSRREPSNFYEIDAKILKEYISKEAESLLKFNKFRISKKGFGTTLFVTIPWQELLMLEIAKKLEI